MGTRHCRPEVQNVADCLQTGACVSISSPAEKRSSPEESEANGRGSPIRQKDDGKERSRDTRIDIIYRKTIAFPFVVRNMKLLPRTVVLHYIQAEIFIGYLSCPSLQRVL
jgi:hypothetical protein